MVYKILTIILLFFFCLNVHAAIYYVDATDGDNSKDGLSEANAWKTIGKVNGFSFSNGDTVKFQRGEIWSDTTLNTPGADDFTFEDYGSGTKPQIDGDIVFPIIIWGAGTLDNLTIRNIYVTGQGYQDGHARIIFLDQVNGATIDGILGEGDATNSGANQEGKNCVELFNCTGTIVIKNCDISDYGANCIPCQGPNSRDSTGIAVNSLSSGTIEIYDNVVHDINGDCIQIAESTPTSVVIYGNTLYNAGEDAIDIKGVTGDTEIYNNTLHRTAGFTGSGGSGGNKTIVQVHGEGSTGSDNVKIRDNTFNGGDCTAIRIGHPTLDAINVQVYNNYIEDHEGSILVWLQSDNVSVHHNLVINPRTFDDGGLDIGGIAENNSSGSNVDFFNNTIYNNIGTCITPFHLVYPNSTEARNNIIYHNSSDVGAYCIRWHGLGNAPTATHNISYNDNNSNLIYWDGTVYDDTEEASWITAGHTGALFSDPLLVNPSANLRLQSTSSAIDAGTDVSLTVDYEGTTIPQGSDPDMGAYEFSSTNPSSPSSLVGSWAMMAGNKIYGRN